MSMVTISKFIQNVNDSQLNIGKIRRENIKGFACVFVLDSFTLDVLKFSLPIQLHVEEVTNMLAGIRHSEICDLMICHVYSYYHFGIIAYYIISRAQ